MKRRAEKSDERKPFDLYRTRDLLTEPLGLPKELRPAESRTIWGDASMDRLWQGTLHHADG